MTPASVTYCRNPFRPSLDRRTVALRRRRRVRALAPGWHTPYIALLNGRPILRAEWRRRVNAGDTLTFVALPLGGGGGGGGGGGKNPLATVAQLALMYYAPTLAGALAGAGASEGMIALYRFGVMMVGGALINAALGTPQLPTPQIAAELAAPSPTYSLQAQGNTARLEQPIPVWYGYNNPYPDFAADPYWEFQGNEQFVYQLLLVTQGWFDIDSIRIEDTPVANFEDISYEIVNPGGTVTLFPSAVTTSVEVSGQELAYNVALGPFVANAAGTSANAIGIDLVASRGLYYANDSGALDSKSITVLIEARPIDAAGSPTGGWATLGTETLTGATTTPQRRSFRYTVAAGRYEVRATRTTTKDTSSRAGHDILWGGLRTYLPGNQQYGDVTLIAMRMKASNQLSAQASRRVNVLGTRMLPLWNPSTGWSAVTATRSIAAAAADVCRAAYGGDLPDTAIDLDGLAALDTIWTARGDEFNGGYDQALSFWEALEKVCRAGRAKPYIQGNIIRFARDGAATLPVAMFTPFNTVAGSFRTEYLLPSDDRADAVTANYVEEGVWKPKPVPCVLEGSTAVRPAKLDLFGITNRPQAWREGIYEAACNRYRTRLHTFETEMEGFILSPLDLIAISRDRPNWGQSGEIVGYTGLDAGDVLELSEPVSFTAGNHYLAARQRNGGMAGPWRVTAGADEFHVVLAEAMTLTPDIGGSRERTAYAFGPGTAYVKRARVLPDGIRARGLHRVEIACVAEDDRVHTADEASVPAAAAGMTLALPPTAPTVTGLRLVVTGLDDAPTWNVSWNPAPGATKYLIEQSPDGANWTRVADTEATSYSFSPQWKGGSVRVAALGKARGAWLATSTPDRTRTLAISQVMSYANAAPAVPTGNINMEAATVPRSAYDGTAQGPGSSWIELVSLTFTAAEACKIFVFGQTSPAGSWTSFDFGLGFWVTHSGGSSNYYKTSSGGASHPIDLMQANFSVAAGSVTVTLKGYMSTAQLDEHYLSVLASIR